MKGQLEFMELIIMVIGVIILIIIGYVMYTNKINEVGTVLIVHHQSRIVRNVCENLPNLMLPGTNRTLGQVFGDVIQSGEDIKDYGRGTFLLNTGLIINETLNEYFGEYSWQVKFPNMVIGVNPPAEYRTCIIFQPKPSPGTYDIIIIKYW